ncbi:Epoxide hydrolase 1 [Talaromyces islandicus]|uniref:Epoxide hydrolase 1 n=1 Tax=Talaromyces islandicus TaxID=28573 RepID=A0A0U1M1A7_TALIS|nr:Epoxide hydrolase 1 [Talaromyces islandicus]
MFSKLITLTLLSGVVRSASLPNVPGAVFGPSPSPFELEVGPGFIANVYDRVLHARAPIPIDGLSPADTDGPELSDFNKVRDFWLHEYDWNRTQQSINEKFKQFTTTVESPQSNYSHPVPLHFVHHQSPRTDAFPLLFIHGWPGSFLEVEHIIDRLTNPPNSSLPAFHVVAPSIPGFGFSPAPQYAGYGPLEAAHSFNSLMAQLNYTKYLINGGDFGGVILRYQANAYPENVVSALSNFWVTRPNATDYARFAANTTTPDETRYLSAMNSFVTESSGYRFVQQTQPLSLAYSLADSPLGFALWIWALIRHSLDPTTAVGSSFSAQEIITWSMMYTIQGPYGGLRFYKENRREGSFEGFGFGTLPYVSQPVAISEFPHDILFDLPLDWAQRDGNVQARYVHTHGGHFAAYEVPELLAQDLWTWFGSLLQNVA